MTLDYGLGKKFDAAARVAWAKVYNLVSTTMKMGRLSVQAAKASSELQGARIAGGARPS